MISYSSKSAGWWYYKRGCGSGSGNGSAGTGTFSNWFHIMVTSVCACGFVCTCAVCVFGYLRCYPRRSSFLFIQFKKSHRGSPFLGKKHHPSIVEETQRVRFITIARLFVEPRGKLFDFVLHFTNILL